MAERSLFTNGTRLRAGWRILVFAAVGGLLSAAGQLAASLFPRGPLGWASLVSSTVAVLLAGLIVVTRLDGRPPGALGLPIGRAAWTESARGLLVGGGLIALASALLFATGAAAFVPDGGSPAGYLASLGWVFVYFAIAAAWEELIFRGYAFQALVEGIGAWPATLIGSGAFSALHGANPNITALGFANIFLAGVLLSLAYLRTRSLWFATGVHLGWNWVMAALIGFPVSGLTFFDTPLYDALERGADWWTGGSFGPEAGVAGTLALLLGIGWLARGGPPGESAEMRELGPIVDRRLQPAEP